MKLEQVQQVFDAHPAINWVVIVGSAIAAWLAPLASIVAIIWGCLQIYSWWEKRKKRRLP